MSIKPKHYPHPVLESQFSDSDPDFNDSSFDFNLNHKSNDTGTRLIFDSTFELTNNTLEELIEEEKATFSLLVICESMSYRTVFQTFNKEDSFSLPSSDLNKTVSVYPYVLANEDIPNYQNRELIEPLNQLSFQIKRGDILAIAPHYEFFLEKDPLVEADSIFEFHEAKMKNPDLISFNPKHSKIIISLPSETYKQVKGMVKYKGPVNQVLISLLYTPAVIDALETVHREISEGNTSDLLNFKDYNWYRTLEIKLNELKLGESLADIDGDDITNVAHQLMENPNLRALKALEELIIGKDGNES